MPLDFVQVKRSGEPVGVPVKIGLEIHGALFRGLPRTDFPQLCRMREFHNDVLYSTEQLARLEADIERRIGMLTDNSLVAILVAMRTLVRDSIEQNLGIEAIAD